MYIENIYITSVFQSQEIDIKKGNNINGTSTGTYAFVQYIDITSVVKAMRTLDGEYLGLNRINLGFGKSLATTCVWIDGVAESVSEKYLASHFSQYGSVTHCVIDRSREHALVFFQQVNFHYKFISSIYFTHILKNFLNYKFISINKC